MLDAVHAYKLIPLAWAGYFLGILLIVLHAAALLFSGRIRAAMLHMHERHGLAATLLAVDFIWIFLLIADIPGLRLGVDLDFFAPYRPFLLLVCPLMWIVLVTKVRELLFPRALGLFLLLLACPLLEAAFLQDPESRLLIPVWCYIVITLSLFWVAKPYLFRRMAAYVATRPRLYAALAWAGLLYGGAVLACAIEW